MRTERIQVENMEFVNEMKICFQARSENESFARVAVVSFLTYLNPTLEAMNILYRMLQASLLQATKTPPKLPILRCVTAIPTNSNT